MILNGTYKCPPDTNEWTKKILQEAHITFSHLSGTEIETMITTEDFQNYWKRVDERTLSSFSGVTFSHYKEAAYHPTLSAMHVAYLTASARKGIPLKRWGGGLSVLLEKISGNKFVHKLRAICLLEADFNWMNKMIFAKQMIGMALERKLIPGECFSKRGSNCISAVMTKYSSATSQEFTTMTPYLKDAILQIATIESCTTLLAYPFEHGVYHNRRSIYCSRPWR